MLVKLRPLASGSALFLNCELALYSRIYEGDPNAGDRLHANIRTIFCVDESAHNTFVSVRISKGNTTCFTRSPPALGSPLYDLTDLREKSCRERPLMCTTDSSRPSRLSTLTLWLLILCIETYTCLSVSFCGRFLPALPSGKCCWHFGEQRNAFPNPQI